MPDVTTETRSPFRVDIVTPTSTLDVSQFVRGIHYGYSILPPWDTCEVQLKLPMSLIDKVLPGTGMTYGEASLSGARRPEPGFWVIVWLADWPNFRSPTAMAVGHVDTIDFGESMHGGISKGQPISSHPCVLRCTGMLALAGKSNVRMTMSGEHNADGFLYDMSSWSGVLAGAVLKNIPENEPGRMLQAIWKAAIKVRAPWGQAGGRAPNTVANTAPAAQTAYAEMGQEIPVVFNTATANSYSDTRAMLLRPVYGTSLMHIPAMFPDSTLWQWLYAMFVPSTEVVELFATLDLPDREGASTNQSTALARSLGGAQPTLQYRFKPFALHPINLANIQQQTHTGMDANTTAGTMSEKLGLFQTRLRPNATPPGYDFVPADIFSHRISYDDNSRVNLVFARPAILSGMGSIRPFSQAGNVVLPDPAQFAHHGLRAFEVDWPYLAVQDLRTTIATTSGAAAQKDANTLTSQENDLLKQIITDWEAAFGPVTGNYSFSTYPYEDKVLAGLRTVKQVEDEWLVLRTSPIAGQSYSVQDKTDAVKGGADALRLLEVVNPRFAGTQAWSYYASLALLRGRILSEQRYRQELLDLQAAGDVSTMQTKYGVLAAAACVSTNKSYLPFAVMNKHLVDALTVDLASIDQTMDSFVKLKDAKGTVPTTVTAAAARTMAAAAFSPGASLVNDFSALNELLWSIVGERERFATMELEVRGRPTLRQGYYITGDLGVRSGRDTCFRYFTGYIESVQHTFEVLAGGEWHTRTRLQLSRVWFSPAQFEYYTPLAASSPGNQTKSEAPSRTIRGKHSGSVSSGDPSKITWWDLSGWDNLHQAYTMLTPKVVPQRLTGDYKVSALIFHHTGMTASSPHSTLDAWRRNSKNKVDTDSSGGEQAAQLEITPDGSIFQYYNLDKHVVYHAVARRAMSLWKGKGHIREWAGNFSIGIDLTGDFRHQQPQEKQEISADLLIRFLSNKFSFAPKFKALPANIAVHGKSSSQDDLMLASQDIEKDGFTIFGHGHWDTTECPGKNLDIGRLHREYAAEPAVFTDDPATTFNVIKVTNANQKDHAALLTKLFPGVKVGW